MSLAPVLLLALAARAAGPAPSAPGSQRLFEQGRYADVVAMLSSDAMQKLRGKELASAMFTLARSYERLNKLDKALSIYQLGIKLFPKDIRLLTGLAQLFHRTNLEERARPLYSRVLEIEKNNIQARLGLAAIDHVLGLLERSADHYELVLEQSPEDAALWRDYAKVLLEMRDFKTAELAVQRSLSLRPGAADTLFVQALVLRGQGRLDEALRVLKALLANGRPPHVVAAQALWLLEAGRNDHASAAAMAAMEDGRTRAVARWVLAMTQARAGRRIEAAGQLKALVAESPAGFEAEAASALLRKWE